MALFYLHQFVKAKPAVEVCVCVKVLHQVNTLLTAHKLLLADGKHASALHHQWVGAAGVHTGQEVVFCHPDRKPLQLAVTQQAGSVQSAADGRLD